jgi:hypothetical protein
LLTLGSAHGLTAQSNFLFRGRNSGPRVAENLVMSGDATDLLILLLGIGFFSLAWQAQRGPPAPGMPQTARSCDSAVEVVGEGVVCLTGDAPFRSQITPGDRVRGPPGHWEVVGRMAAARQAVLRVPVDLNRASLEELASLEGIGPKLAARIERARPFRSPGELARVPGVGEARARRLAPRVAVTPSTRVGVVEYP